MNPSHPVESHPVGFVEVVPATAYSQIPKPTAILIDADAAFIEFHNAGKEGLVIKHPKSVPRRMRVEAGKATEGHR